MDQISITDSKRSWLAPGKGGMRGVIKNKIIRAWLNNVLLRSRQSNNIQVVQARLNFSLVHMILGTKKIGVYWDCAHINENKINETCNISSDCLRCLLDFKALGGGG